IYDSGSKAVCFLINSTKWSALGNIARETKQLHKIVCSCQCIWSASQNVSIILWLLKACCYILISTCGSDDITSTPYSILSLGSLCRLSFTITLTAAAHLVTSTICDACQCDSLSKSSCWLHKDGVKTGQVCRQCPTVQTLQTRYNCIGCQ